MSLRIFMALVALLGVVLGCVVHRAQLQREAVVEIERAGGLVCYDWQWKDGRDIPGGEPWAPRWLVDRIGVDYFGSVTVVNLLPPASEAAPLLSRIGHLDRLEDLSLSGPGVTDATLVHLTSLSRLKVLDLGGTGISDAGLANLEGLTGLEELSLAFNGARIGDAGLAHLKGLTRLRWLNLAGTGVSDAGLVNLKGLTRLETLNLNEAGHLGPSQADPMGFTAPPPLPEPGETVVDGIEAGRLSLPDEPRPPGMGVLHSSIGDAGLAHLKGLSRLQGLDLGGTAVSDAGLVYLEALPGLELLSLARTDVGDSGLPHLKRLTKLLELDLAGTKVSADGVRELRRDLPKTKVDHHNLHVR